MCCRGVVGGRVWKVCLALGIDAQAQHTRGQFSQLGHHFCGAQATTGLVPVIEKAGQAAGGLGSDAGFAKIQMPAGATLFQQGAELFVELLGQRT